LWNGERYSPFRAGTAQLLPSKTYVPQFLIFPLDEIFHWPSRCVTHIDSAKKVLIKKSCPARGFAAGGAFRAPSGIPSGMPDGMPATPVQGVDPLAGIQGREALGTGLPFYRCISNCCTFFSILAEIF
jgi:hypothetical protein